MALRAPALTQEHREAYAGQITRALALRAQGQPADGVNAMLLIRISAGRAEDHDEALALVRQRLPGANPHEVIRGCQG